ncbi:MAG TPA: hypothetical protein VJS91_07575 [Nitrososphaeraceae archaeon]|nr:hypothetical protein [Nitrososphaeraceae archaeon]
MGYEKVSNDTIGKFLLKLKEMTIRGDTDIDMYKIGENIGLLDKIQTDHIVEILSKDGYVHGNHENSKIGLTEEGLERLEN